MCTKEGRGVLEGRSFEGLSKVGVGVPAEGSSVSTLEENCLEALVWKCCFHLMQLVD